MNLVISDADGKNEQLLLTSSEPIISPTWSPDSKKVAYVSFETGMAKVYIQDIASGEREVVIENSKQISSPAWSPDGKFLSLTMYQDGNAEIYILNLKNKKWKLIFEYCINNSLNYLKKLDQDGSRTAPSEAGKINFAPLKVTPASIPVPLIFIA